MVDNNGGEEPKLRAQILVSLAVDGTMSLQATSSDLITNLGMLECAKNAIVAQNQQKKANSHGIIGAQAIDPMLLKRPPQR